MESQYQELYQFFMVIKHGIYMEQVVINIEI